MRDALEIGGQQLRFAVADDLRERAIDLEEAAVEIDDGHADRRVLERAAKGTRVVGKRGLPCRGPLLVARIRSAGVN